MNTLDAIDAAHEGYLERLGKQPTHSLAHRLAPVIRIIADQEFENAKCRVRDPHEAHKPHLDAIETRITERLEELHVLLWGSPLGSGRE